MLSTLAEAGPLSQIDLARALSIDRTAMVYLLDELEDARLVERVRNGPRERSPEGTELRVEAGGTRRPGGRRACSVSVKALRLYGTSGQLTTSDVFWSVSRPAAFACWICANEVRRRLLAPGFQVTWTIPQSGG